MKSLKNTTQRQQPQPQPQPQQQQPPQPTTNTPPAAPANFFGGGPGKDDLDAAYITLCMIVVFTMQSGFALLESGRYHQVFSMHVTRS